MSTISYRKQNEEVLLYPKGRGLNNGGFVLLQEVKGLYTQGVKVLKTTSDNVGGIQNRYHKESAKSFFTTFNEDLLSKVITIKEQQKLWSL